MRYLVAAALLVIAPLSQAASLVSDYRFLGGSATVQDAHDDVSYERNSPVGGLTNETRTAFAQLGDSNSSLTGNLSANLGPVVGGAFGFSSTSLLLSTATGGDYSASSRVASGFDFSFNLGEKSAFSISGTNFLNPPVDDASEGFFRWSLTGPGNFVLAEYETFGTGALQTFVRALDLDAGDYTFSIYGQAGTTRGIGSVSQTTAYNLQGSVTPAPVPLPAAAWLLLSGLGGIAAFARRRRAPAA